MRLTIPAAPIRFLLSPSLGEVKEHVRAEFFGRALTPGGGGARPSYEALERELQEGRVDLAWAIPRACASSPAT